MAKKKYKIKPKDAKKKAPDQKPQQTARREPSTDFPFKRKNYFLFGLGIAAIVLGFIALWLGDISFAPVLLIAGYCVLIPLAILLNGRKREEEEQPAENPGD